MTKLSWKYDIGDRLIDYKDDGSLKRDITIIDKRIDIKEFIDNDTEDSHYISRKYYKYR